MIDDIPVVLIISEIPRYHSAATHRHSRYINIYIYIYIYIYRPHSNTVLCNTGINILGIFTWYTSIPSKYIYILIYHSKAVIDTWAGTR